MSSLLRCLPACSLLQGPVWSLVLALLAGSPLFVRQMHATSDSEGGKGSPTAHR